MLSDMQQRQELSDLFQAIYWKNFISHFISLVLGTPLDLSDLVSVDIKSLFSEVLVHECRNNNWLSKVNKSTDFSVFADKCMTSTYFLFQGNIYELTIHKIVPITCSCKYIPESICSRFLQTCKNLLPTKVKYGFISMIFSLCSFRTY